MFAVISLCGFVTFLGFIIWGYTPLKAWLTQLTAFLESYNGLHYSFQKLPPDVLENNLKVR